MSEKKPPKAKKQSIPPVPQDCRDLLMNAPIGIYTATPAGRFIYVNPTMARMFGYASPQEMIETITDIGTQLYADPKDREAVMHLLEKHGEVVNHERRHINKDGSIVWISANVRAVRDENGNTILYQGFFTDITPRKEAEEVLRKNEERYRSIVRVSHTGVWEYEFDTGNEWCNPEYFEMLGYDPGMFNTPDGRSFITEAWIGLIHPDDQDRASRLFANYLAYGSIGMYENYFRMRHKDGHWVWIWSRGQTLRNPDGTLSNLTVGTHTDITERILAEKALRESEWKYRSLTERMSDILWTCDLEMKVNYVSPSIEKVLGFTTEEWMKIPVSEQLSPGTLQLVTEKLEDELQHNGGRPPDRQIRLDMEYYHGDGTIRYLESGLFFIRDERGKPIGIQGLSRDITKRKQAEEKLKETLDRLRRAIDTTFQVMVAAVEARDPYTAGHQIRVAYIAEAIAAEMGLSQDQIDGIHIAGTIHDIGKLSIPAEILSKPAKLSGIEFTLVKEHSREGYKILKDVESPWPLAEIVYQHHERMDGSGYPRNLKGNAILLEARILGVADEVEAMATHRPYRPGLGIDAALQDIENNRGILYDADVVDACLRLFREKGFKLERT